MEKLTDLMSNRDLSEYGASMQSSTQYGGGYLGAENGTMVPHPPLRGKQKGYKSRRLESSRC